MTQEEIDKAFEGRWRIKGKTFFADEVKQEEIVDLCRDFFEAGCELSAYHKEEKLSDAVKLTVRSNKFFDSLNTPENVDKYGTQILKDFFDYWTEPNRSGTKMRFELQQTFDINRRLARWARNNFNSYGTNKQQQQQQQRQQRLAEVAERIAKYTKDT